MVTVWTAAATLVGLLGLLVIAASASVVAYVVYRRHEADPPPGIGSDRLRAYNEIMNAVIGLNRTAMDLVEDESFWLEAERLVFDQESELEAPFKDVMAAYQKNLYIVSPSVRDAVKEYIEHLSTYRPGSDGVDPNKTLSLSGDIVQAMRDDLDLPSIFQEVDVSGEDNDGHIEADAAEGPQAPWSGIDDEG